MPDVERELRAARPLWPEPSSGAEARARAALGLAPAPRSARSWLARARGGRGARLLVPAALLLTAGAAVAATIITTGSSSGASAGRPASLAFGPVQIVGTPVSYIEGSPAVAVDGRGAVTVVWGRAGNIVASTRPAGGDWSKPERLSDPATRSAYPRVGADRAGNVTVTWRERTAGRRVVQRFTLPSGAPAGELSDVVGRRWAVVARTRPAGGRWGAPLRLSPDVDAVRDLEDPGLAVAGDGTAVASWDIGGAMWASRRPAGGAWAAPVEIGRGGGEAVDPQVATTPSGTVIVAWSNRVGLGIERRYEIRAAVLGPDREWSTAEVLNDPVRNPPYAAGAVNAAGAAVVSWNGEGSGLTAGQGLAATREAGGAWGPQTRVGGQRRGTFGARPLVAVEPDGHALAVDGVGARAFRRAPGEDWQPLAIGPIGGRDVAAALLQDAVGDPILARGALYPSRTVVGPLGAGPAARAPTVIHGLGNGLVAAAGPDGTTALAWITGAPRAGVAAAVAEPTR